jgi:hypothetical protein
MGKFSGPLIAQKKLTEIRYKFLWILPMAKIKETWIIHEPFIYTTKAGDVISIPAGYETDFASIPEICGFIMQKDGPYSQPAVVHDFLYGGRIYPRKKCDEILYEAMGDTEVPTPIIDRRLIYDHVRLYGWLFY